MRAVASRQYLSTALFAAEIVESFQTLTGKADPGHTDGEAVSRVLAFKLAPEIALIPGFNSAVSQQWWNYPQLAQVGGRDGASAFWKMISLLEQNAQNPDGTLNLPADGNPFPGMSGAKPGGLFAGKAPDSLAQDAQRALGLHAQLEQQFASLKSTLQQIQGDVSAPAALPRTDIQDSLAVAIFAYGPPLVASLVANLEQQAAPYRAPQYDQTLQKEFWKHVYNELPGTGPHTDRLQVITGAIQAPLAVQITGTIRAAKLEADGDLHIYFQPDDPHFPSNQGAGQSPLEIEIIYAGPVTQADAKQTEAGFRNPFDISRLGAGTRIQAAGPLVFDRAHGKAVSDGKNVNSGLEIHPLVGMTILSAASPAAGPASAPATVSELSVDLGSAVGQAETLGQTLDSLTALLQKMKQEAPTS